MRQTTVYFRRATVAVTIRHDFEYQAGEPTASRERRLYRSRFQPLTVNFWPPAAPWMVIASELTLSTRYRQSPVSASVKPMRL
jgi:hypothetical protein